MEQAYIQYQTMIGNWITVQQVLNTQITVLNGMQQVKNTYSNARVRAISEKGNIIDIMG